MSCIPDGQPLPLAVLAYALFVALAVVLPGLALLRLLRLPVEPAAVVPLGLGACAAAYGASLVAGRPWLFPALLGALALVALVRRHPWRAGPGPSLRGAWPPCLLFLALYAVTQFPQNRCAADGSFLLDTLEPVDTAFHVGVTWELTQAWPPQVPGLAGVPLDYHFAPHLVRAAALRFAGVHPYDALTRFDLVLWTLALVLAWRAAAAALGAPPAVVALAPFTLLLSDLSWLLAGQARGAWLAELLGGNLLVTLFFTNALVPALALLLVAITALARAEAPATVPADATRWRALAALCGLALPFFKIFLAAHYLAGLAIAVALTPRRLRTALAGLPCLFATLLLAGGGGSRAVEIALDPLAVVQQALQALGHEPAQGTRLLLSAPAWLALSLGLRAAGVPATLRALRSRSVPAVSLAAMALLGWPVRLLGRVSADGRFDEAVYFTLQSGALLWFFAAGALAGAWRRGRRGAVLVAALLAVPTTVDFLARRGATPPVPLPAAVLRQTARLAALTEPGEVVLTPSHSRYPPAPLVFIGRRVAYAEYLPYLAQFAPPDELARRLRAVRRFFRGVDPDEARTSARALGARFVVVSGDEWGVERGPLLEPVRDDDGVRLYRLRASRPTPRPRR